MTRTLNLMLNGVPTQRQVEDRTLLSDALQEDGGCGVTVGCEHGVCGSCTVQVDHAAVRACLMLAVQTEGRQVHTVRSLTQSDGQLGTLQHAFQRHHALQCGYCTAGILMAVSAYLRTRPTPTRGELLRLLSGHICRCTGYTHIVNAILSVTGEAT